MIDNCQGGGSTFGVILSATLKTYPVPSLTWSHFEITQNSRTREPFWQAAAYFHSQLPHLVESGLMGYYNISSISPFEPSTPLILGAGVWILNTNTSAFNALLDLVLDHIQATYPINVTRTSRYVPNYYDWWKATYPPGAVGTESQLGSRLLDKKALSIPVNEIAPNLAAAYGDLVILANLVSGPGVWNAKPAGGLGSMTPAWRKTVVELSTCSKSFSPLPVLASHPRRITSTNILINTVVPAVWPAKNASAKATQLDLLTNKYMAALRNWAPDTGTYLNEADVNEPDLPQAYWGEENYERLLGIKRKYDPEGVFWCEPCVGGGDWKIEGDGRVCRI